MDDPQVLESEVAEDVVVEDAEDDANPDIRPSMSFDLPAHPALVDPGWVWIERCMKWEKIQTQAQVPR